MHRLVALAALSLPTSAWALELDVYVDPAAARQAGVDPGATQAGIRQAASGALPLEGPEAFLDQLATASALASAGIGVDYASNPERFYAGANVGAASSGGAADAGEAPDVFAGPGFAAQVSAGVGVNLGLFSEDTSMLRRVVFSMNGSVVETTLGGFDVEMGNLGAHLQVKVLPGRELGAASWGGLDLTTGYEVATWSMSGADELTVRADGVRWDAAGTVDLSAESRTIPIEVSTNARFAVLSAYVGGALDVRPSADAGGEVALGGPIVATVRGRDVSVGTVDARLGLTGTTATVAPRFFAGIQFNVTVLKIFGHLNVAADDSLGGHVGARVAL